MKAIAVIGLLGVLQVALASPSDSLLRLVNLKRVKRLIGGEDIEKGDWPWLVHLKGKIPTKFFWGIPTRYTNVYCGGSVVDKRWVLTAAHCFHADDINEARLQTPKYWHAKVGEVERTHGFFDKVKHWTGIAIGKNSWRLWYLHSTKLVIHPDYDASDHWKNDIALLKLEKDLPIGSEDEDIGLVQLPEQGEEIWPGPDTDCIMKGWGCSERDGKMKDVAQSAKLPVVDGADCRDVYFGLSTEDRLCAGYDLQSKGICKGDSGGPLVCKRANSWIQAGIASFTSGSRPGQVPGVFTRVSKYVDWIRKTIEDN